MFFDDFEAWLCGSIIPNVFYKFCGFGAGDITLKYNINLDKLSLEDRVLINGMIESKRYLKPWEFVKDTQRENGAWASVYSNGNGVNKKNLC